VAETTGPERPPIVHTLETRWFGPGAVPGDVLAWFEALPGQAGDQPARRDFYLQPIRDDGLSVKLREGGLEVKQRRESFGLIRFNASVAGLVERWVKWRFPLDRASSPMQSLAAGDSAWTAVDKERRLKYFQYSEAGATQIGPSPGEAGGERPAGDALTFHVELAQVWAGTRRFWSVGYEAIWAGRNSLQRLLVAVDPQFRDSAPGQFSSPNSFGYPRWLAALDNPDSPEQR